MRYAAVKPTHGESAFKSLMTSPPGRPGSRSKKKPKTGFSSSYNSSSNKSTALTGSVSKKFLPSYYGRKGDLSRGNSYTKRKNSGSKLSSRTQRSNSRTLKSTKSSLGYSSKSKYSGGKSISKYASTDAFKDASKTFKPFKVTSKQSKNSSVDYLQKSGRFNSTLKYSSSDSGFPSNLKIKKEKTKTKKKRAKHDKEEYAKKFGISTTTKDAESALNSINIINANHLHLSSYPHKSNLNSSGGDNEKKENIQGLINKPESGKKKKRTPISGGIRDERMKLKQEIKKTKPKKSTTKNYVNSKKITPNTSKREHSEVRKTEPVVEKETKGEKRSHSQPPVEDPPIDDPQANEPALLDSNLPDYVANYAFATRTGMIPEKPDKQNQDIYFINKDFANIKNNWFFGVCDGHGVNGHFASDHVKQYLPQNIELLDYMLMMQKHKESQKTPEERKDSTSGFFEDDEENLATYLLSKDHKKKYTVISEGFIKTALRYPTERIQCRLLRNDCCHCDALRQAAYLSNLGDSRAVLGSIRTKEEAETIQSNTTEVKMESVAGPDKTGKKMWVSTSLSLDHKPDRADEFKRIMESQGRVDPFREENGEPVGPARVWLRDANVPGLAMSRSIGDLVASSVGVIPEPEFFELVLSEPDKFIVIASDGVWEFIENDECVRLVAPYWENNDPQGACKKLTDLSVEHWKREDEVIDDITVMVIFLKVPK
eukprot:CAMPEP_0197006712 /NCGR_PEP_ID=MMETSP1380-20130617/36638_1 /TAXON_ID=5936 /ORGANISM="Euplotes crassus, Strain CT5" /LENGTH=712 /DNA_ID=CAMNT_0042426415 /DNA_START=245 /DNA_END=2383 /DNA_ORIENTATION=+